MANLNPEKIRISKREYQKKYRKTHRYFNVAFDLKEATTLVENAGKTNLDPHDFIRQAALRRKIIVPPGNHRITLELKAEVRRIGINLNQIAKSLNSLRASENVGPAEVSLAEITRDLKLVLSKI